MTAELIEFTIPDAADPRIVGVSVEAKLRDWNLDYAYDPAFDLAAIEHADYTQVRAAEGRVDPAQVDEYKRQMDNGAVFPPIVVMQGNILIDGNTRVEAIRKLRGKNKTFPAFVVHFPTAAMARAFAASMNQRNGRRLSTGEAKEAALALVECGFADEAISLEVGYSRTQIGKWKSQQRLVEALERAGRADLATPLTQTAQQELGALKSDPVVVEAAKAIVNSNAPAGSVRELVKAVKATNSEAEALDTIEKVRAGWAVSGQPARPQVSPGLRQFRMAVSKIIDSAPADLVEPVAERRNVAAEQWRRLANMANDVVRLYEASGV